MSDAVEKLSPPGLTLGVLINMHSRRNRKRPPDLAGLRAGGAHVEAPADEADVEPALRRMAAAGVDLVAVHGGDGTVLSALTAILCQNAFPQPPILALLPGGTTNMTAADIGFAGPPATLARVAEIAANGGGRLLQREALLLENAASADGAAPPQAGMFFGAIGICRAIAFCRRHLHARGVVGGPAAWLTLGPLLLKAMTSDKPDGVLAGAAARLTVRQADGAAETLDGPWSVLMASSLRKLALGSRPFWGEGASGHGVDVTCVRAPPFRLWRMIWPLLFGKPGKRPPEPHYVSRRAGTIEIAYTGAVTLDGEMYAANAATPLRLSASPPVRFLVG